MDFTKILTIVGPLIPTLFDITKEAIVAAKGNDELAIGILMGILGASDENKTRAAIVIANLKAIEEFGPK